MRTPTLGSVFYSPGDSTNITTLPELVRFIRDENLKIGAAISALAAGHLDMEYKAPEKPSMGDIRLADGVTWNPGSGIGVYWYDSVALTWNFLG